MDRHNDIVYKGDYGIIKYKDDCILNINSQLIKELLILYYDMSNANTDIVLVLSGSEGCGKSLAGRVLGALFCWLAGTYLKVDNIHFDLLPYLTSSVNGKKFQVNILDEAKDVLDKKRSMSKSNKAFTDYMSKCRFKNQVHIIILPAVHDLDTRISLWRMNFLIHNIKLHYKDKESYSGYKLQRGYFKVYKKDSELQKAINNYTKVGKYLLPKLYHFHGKFIKNEPFTDEELILYDEKKNKSIIDVIEKIKEMENGKADGRIKKERDTLISLAIDHGIPLDVIADSINKNLSYIKKIKDMVI